MKEFIINILLDKQGYDLIWFALGYVLGGIITLFSYHFYIKVKQEAE